MNKEYDWELGPWAKSGKKLLTAKSINVDTKAVKCVITKKTVIVTMIIALSRVKRA